VEPPSQFTHVIALLLLLARIGDIGSTYLATPKLRLEANSLARRWRWPFGFATLLAAAIPYYSLPAGIILLVGSLLVCFSNLSTLWLMRAVGEDAYHDLLVLNAGRAHLGFAIVSILGSGVCVAAVGVLLWYLYPDPDRDWAFYIAIGILAYAVAITSWRTVAFIRLRKAGAADNALPREGGQ
jgi:hypothetical protein